MKRKIGYACISQSTQFRTSRRFALKDYSEARLIETIQDNLNDLQSLLKWNVAHNILMFRISSDIIPFASHPTNTFAWWAYFEDQFKTIGAYIKEQGIRVSMHPGQYTVLNSPDGEVVNRSIADLQYHTRFLDAMDLSSNHKLILHVGGVYGDKSAAKIRFQTVYQSLDSAIKNRLILENDDTSYTALDVLEICKGVQMPMVLDNLHHQLNPSEIAWDTLIQNVLATWTRPEERAKFHYSDQDPWERKNGHSQSIHTDKFLDYINSLKDYPVDVMLEVKDKDISTLKANLLIQNEVSVIEREALWQHYNLRIMETGKKNHQQLRSFIDANESIETLFLYIDATLLLPFDSRSFMETVLHVFTLITPYINARELKHFETLLKTKADKPLLIKNNLLRLAQRYDVPELRSTYYFQYTSRL